MPPRIQSKTRPVFIWLAIFPSLTAILVYATRSGFKRSVEWVSHTEQVLVALDDLLELATKAENDQLSYRMTGKDLYLRRFAEDAAAVKAKLAEVRSLTSDNPTQRQNVQVVERALRAKLAELRRAEEGPRTTGQLREATGRMIDEERRLLKYRLGDRERQDLAVNILLATCVTAVLGLLVWATILIRRYSEQEQRAKDEVMLLNQTLEQRIVARTRELEQANLSLNRSNRDLEQFTSVASHDLREPLRMIASYIELLRRRYQGKLDEDADEYITYTVRSAARLQELIDDLLLFARTGAERLKREPVELDAVLSEALRHLEPNIQESGARITSAPLPRVTGDSIKLQVFQNLIANAIKFRKAGERPEVKVAVARKGRDWEISIQDNGIGFDPKSATKMFQVFQRLRPASEYPGTGIGLAICQRIVEGHGGRIWAESQEGAGATFFFTLPADS